MGAAQTIAIGALVGFIAWRVLHWNDTDPETGETDDSAADVVDLGYQAIDYGSAIFEQTDDMTAQANLRAFLAAIRLGEGTSDDRGYSRLFGGGTFTDYSTHPGLNGWGGVRLSAQMARDAGYADGVAVSTAAGAYQITRTTYRGAAAALGVSDFSPDTQDRIAIYLIRQKGALGDVLAGRAEVAAGKVRKVWASLPNAGYGQRTVSMQAFLNQYTNAGGEIA